MLNHLPTLDLMQYENIFIECGNGDYVFKRKATQLVDEIYNSSIYSRWFGLWMLNQYLFKYNLHSGNYSLIFGLYESKFLTKYFKDFEDIHKIGQMKKFGKNLLDHTILCMDSCFDILVFTGFLFNSRDVSICGLNTFEIYEVLRFCSMFHDIGKIEQDMNHEKYSAEIAEEYLKKIYPYGFPSTQDVAIGVILSHMKPHGYGRGEKWGNNAINNFVEGCGSKGIAQLSVLMAIIDKYASTRNFRECGFLIELYSKISNNVV